MNYITEGELVDTYGGDFTYRDVWYEEEDGEYYFYEQYFGAKPVGVERITDPDEIKILLSLIQNNLNQ
jgi:hypothetical protein